MRKNISRVILLMTVAAFISVAVLELDAFARAGGGTSSGSRGSRSYSSPSRPSSQPSPAREQAAPTQQPAGSGFLRSLGGGILGGLIGGMLFRSLGFGGFGGSGIGLFEILFIAGIGFLIYRMVKRGREERPSYQASYDQGFQSEDRSLSQGGGMAVEAPSGVQEGLSYVRRMDGSFDEALFRDAAMDTFFKIQGAWMSRNISTAGSLLTDEMKGIFQKDIDRLLREKRMNRLENIAVRNVEITEAWQESGQDFITVLFYANLLDYTTDDVTGEVVEGSRTELVKFEEYWTFTRPVGNNPWRLSAINQG